MNNGKLYEKNVKAMLVDELLKGNSPFEVITRVTGWTPEEIWIYIDMVYRKKHPEAFQDENNKSYFCWGETDDLSKNNKIY